MKPVNAGRTGMIPNSVIRPMICLARLNWDTSQLDGKGPPCFCRLPIRCLSRHEQPQHPPLSSSIPTRQERQDPWSSHPALLGWSPVVETPSQTTIDTFLEESSPWWSYLTEDVLHAGGGIHQIDAIHRHPVDLLLPSTSTNDLHTLSTISLYLEKFQNTAE